MDALTPPPRRPAPPFRSGQSGNPSGRPKGAKDRPGRAVEAALRHAVRMDPRTVMRALSAAARAGDAPALQVLLAVTAQIGAEAHP